jgi:hypothetical protein
LCGETEPVLTKEEADRRKSCPFVSIKERVVTGDAECISCRQSGLGRLCLDKQKCSALEKSRIPVSPDLEAQIFRHEAPEFLHANTEIPVL